jgi:hypothetical protein
MLRNELPNIPHSRSAEAIQLKVDSRMFGPPWAQGGSEADHSRWASLQLRCAPLSGTIGNVGATYWVGKILGNCTTSRRAVPSRSRLQRIAHAVCWQGARG